MLQELDFLLRVPLGHPQSLPGDRWRNNVQYSEIQNLIAQNEQERAQTNPREPDQVELMKQRLELGMRLEFPAYAGLGVFVRGDFDTSGRVCTFDVVYTASQGLDYRFLVQDLGHQIDIYWTQFRITADPPLAIGLLSRVLELSKEERSRILAVSGPFNGKTPAQTDLIWINCVDSRRPNLWRVSRELPEAAPLRAEG